MLKILVFIKSYYLHDILTVKNVENVKRNVFIANKEILIKFKKRFSCIKTLRQILLENKILKKNTQISR